MRKANRAERRSVKQFLASKGLDYAIAPSGPAPEAKRAASVTGFRDRAYVVSMAQRLANILGRPQTVLRDNGNKCYHITETAARNEKPPHIPARKRRHGGLVRSKNPYYPISRIGGVTVYPAKG